MEKLWACVCILAWAKEKGGTELRNGQWVAATQEETRCSCSWWERQGVAMGVRLGSCIISKCVFQYNLHLNTFCIPILNWAHAKVKIKPIYNPAISFDFWSSNWKMWRGSVAGRGRAPGPLTLTFVCVSGATIAFRPWPVCVAVGGDTVANCRD